MGKIDTSGWKEFRVGDLFAAERGKVKNIQPLCPGETPIIAAGAYNQGIAGMYEIDSAYENRITISCNGAGCGSTFYHPYKFNVNGDAVTLIEKSSMSDKAKSFIACILNGAFTRKYSYEDMLSKREKPVYFGCIENALQTLYPVSVLGCYELGLNYACDPEGFTTSLLTSLSRRNFKTTSKETPTGAYIPKKVAAARLASKMTNMFVPTKNESQKAARHLLNSHKGTICKKNIVDVTLCNKSAGNMQIKIPLDNFLYYEPKTKEIFVNICDICEGERKKVNRYVKDCGFLVRENLVPMMLVQRFEA